MKRTILLFVLLLLACAPQIDDQTPTPSDALIPYATHTPSLTPEGPAGLVVSFETPLPSPTPFSYEVQAGDTLSEIAERFGVSLDTLTAANPNVSPNSMSIGTVLNVPSNPANPTGASTPTPVPAPVKQIECYPTADKGMWCFLLVYNDTTDILENLSARVTLVDASGQEFLGAQALPPLNILPPGNSLPLIVFFPPQIPANAHPRAQILTGIRLSPDDARYLLASVQNTLVQVGSSGRSAQVSGTVRLPEDSVSASSVWVAAVAYDDAGQVVGMRRWESNDEIPPGGNLPFAFEVFSQAGSIERVEFVVEARP
jgi:LysM repeat protein